MRRKAWSTQVGGVKLPMLLGGSDHYTYCFPQHNFDHILTNIADVAWEMDDDGGLKSLMKAWVPMVIY